MAVTAKLYGASSQFGRAGNVIEVDFGELEHLTQLWMWPGQRGTSGGAPGSAPTVQGFGSALAGQGTSVLIGSGPDGLLSADRVATAGGGARQGGPGGEGQPGGVGVQPAWKFYDPSQGGGGEFSDGGAGGNGGNGGSAGPGGSGGGGHVAGATGSSGTAGDGGNAGGGGGGAIFKDGVFVEAFGGSGGTAGAGSPAGAGAQGGQYVSGTTGGGETGAGGLATSPGEPGAAGQVVAAGSGYDLRGGKGGDGAAGTDGTAGGMGVNGSNNVSAPYTLVSTTNSLHVGLGKIEVFQDGTLTATFEANGQPQLYTVEANVAPNAPVLTFPVSGETVNREQTVRFGWDFSDDNTLDSQSQFQIQIRAAGGSATTVDVTAELPSTHYDVAGGTLAAGDFEWRVRTWDSSGEVGEYSSWEPFEAVSPPAGPTVTAPSNNATISAEEFTVTWSAAEQDAYQLRRVADLAGAADTDTVYFDTGQVDSSGARSRTVDFPVNDRHEHVQVRVLRNALWSPWATVRVEVSYTKPAVPYTSADATLTPGALQVQAFHPAPGTGQPSVESVDIFRRLETDTGDGVRVAANRTPTTQFDDWTVASGVPYAYRVRAYGTNGTSVMSPWSSDVVDPEEPVEPGEGDSTLTTTLPFALA